MLGRGFRAGRRSAGRAPGGGHQPRALDAALSGRRDAVWADHRSERPAVHAGRRAARGISFAGHVATHAGGLGSARTRSQRRPARRAHASGHRAASRRTSRSNRRAPSSTSLAATLAAEHPDTNRAQGATVAGLLEQLTRDVRPSLYALAAAVIALLLVACANAAGLLIGGALGAAARVRHAPGARRQPVPDRPADRRGEPHRRPAGRGRGLRAGVWAGDFLVGAATAAGVPRASEIRIGPMTFVVGVMLSLACTTVCALVAAYESDARG